MMDIIIANGQDRDPGSRSFQGTGEIITREKGLRLIKGYPRICRSSAPLFTATYGLPSKFECGSLLV
jgi:hypothetical protein